ncbi:MAG: ATPase, T2SS/T4P/T4SS family, partial [Hylemonella sp.]|nr:ATPase, T2SS/T4P/T4SS family [Hylemonella sp.]
MSAVMKPGAGNKPSEQGGLNFEALFYRQLQQVATKIHETSNLDQLMLDVSPEICKLFNADRLTLYAVTEDNTSIISKIKTGLTTNRELKLPISPQSIAGYVAYSRKMLNFADVYDESALQKTHPQLRFLQEVDKRSGYRTKQMLVAPIMEGKALYGVLQIINSKSDQPFGDVEVEGAKRLCTTLATAIRQRLQKTEDGRRRPSRYDSLIKSGLLSEVELGECIQEARNQGASVEHFLREHYEISTEQIGQSLATFFGVKYEGFNAGRIRSEFLHGPLKREFVQGEGWIPLEDTPQGLLVMCLDPEATRGSRMVPQVFPRISKFEYRVTTQADFEQTLDQLFGVAVTSGSVDDMLADLGSGVDDDAMLDDPESAAAANELVKFVNKIIIDAYNQGVSDIHVEPMPGKAKTGIRFRIDGSLAPYIEVPAAFRAAMVTRLKIMCDLDISERRKPQDGKIKFKKYGPLDIELRVATIPSAGGVEDVVMRILAAGEPIPIEKLGLTTHNRTRLESTVSKPYGLFYVCG